MGVGVRVGAIGRGRPGRPGRPGGGGRPGRGGRGVGTTRGTGSTANEQLLAGGSWTPPRLGCPRASAGFHTVRPATPISVAKQFWNVTSPPAARRSASGTHRTSSVAPTDRGRAEVTPLGSPIVTSSRLRVTSTGVPAPPGCAHAQAEPAPSRLHPTSVTGRPRERPVGPMSRHQSCSTHGAPTGAELPRTSPSAPSTASSRHTSRRPATPPSVCAATSTSALRSSAAGAAETVTAGAAASQPPAVGTGQLAVSGSGTAPGARTVSAAATVSPCSAAPLTRAVRSSATATAGGAATRPTAHRMRRPPSCSVAPPGQPWRPRAASCPASHTARSVSVTSATRSSTVASRTLNDARYTTASQARTTPSFGPMSSPGSGAPRRPGSVPSPGTWSGRSSHGAVPSATMVMAAPRMGAAWACAAGAGRGSLAAANTVNTANAAASVWSVASEGVVAARGRVVRGAAAWCARRSRSPVVSAMPWSACLSAVADRPRCARAAPVPGWRVGAQTTMIPQPGRARPPTSALG